MKTFINKFVNHVSRLFQQQSRDWESASLVLSAKSVMLADSWRTMPTQLKLSTKEFRVYSQWGDDGIIQFLLTQLEIASEAFIEFGVGDYFESNTHFLLINNNWRGFVVDGSKENIAKVCASPLYWRYQLDARASFVTAENVNKVLSQSDFDKIGLLHIDIDGNDYWVLKALDLSIYQPDILILEYNAMFGARRQIAVPYDPAFMRFTAHYSGMYFGASLPALCTVAEEKGYYFIGCNSAGNNAYFLRGEYQSVVPSISLEDGYVEAKFRDARDQNAELTLQAREECKAAIRGLPVFNACSGQVEPF